VTLDRPLPVVAPAELPQGLGQLGDHGEVSAPEQVLLVSLRLDLPTFLRASVRRHRSAQADRSTLRSIRPTQVAEGHSSAAGPAGERKPLEEPPGRHGLLQCPVRLNLSSI
jgi:hypothetical protein